MRNQWLRAFVGYVWGLLLFFGVAWALKRGLGSMESGSAVVSQIVLKSALVLVALIGWNLLKRPLGEMGWRKANWWNRSHLVWFVVAAASMMAGSVVMLLMGLRHPLASQMSFLQVVLVIWLLSSLSEEVYVRGLVQSWVADRDDACGISSAFEPSIVSSAFLFASMHGSLMWSPIGVKGGLTIVLSTLGVGWACAVLRASSKSLMPAIACHVVANVAAVPGRNPRHHPLSSGLWSFAGIPNLGLKGASSRRRGLRTSCNSSTHRNGYWTDTTGEAHHADRSFPDRRFDGRCLDRRGLAWRRCATLPRRGLA